MFREDLTDKGLQRYHLIRHHQRLVTQVQLLTILDEGLSLSDLLINEYLLIAKAKITLLRRHFLLRLLEEDFSYILGVASYRLTDQETCILLQSIFQ